MNAEIMGALEQLEREKGIPKDYMLEKISAALLAAYKKDHTGYTENVMVSVVDGELKMFVQKEAVEELMFPDTEISLDNARKLVPDAVEGDIINVEVDARQFGRIAAKTAKDVIIQGIREAEHTVIFDKFTSKSHEMITGTVLRIEPDSGDMIIRIATGAAGTGNGTDKTNALLAAGEQVRGESYTEGDSIRVYVVDVRRSSHGPQVIVSRTHPGLVKRLFEREVPEIADGTVEVKSIAREAGNRTKLAVWSSDPDVDAVGTCVGPRGGRVGAVVDELDGEKMDIIQYSEDPAEFVAAALSPADVVEVLVQPGTKNCRVVVPDDQLSLAIGKEGQNARLAARLTGYKIDIKAESDADALNFGEEEPLPEEPEDIIPEETPETEAEITE
ncbi:MAG: transcription termination/antitermination protein NusA [Oscillospiraceae bacterium]|nr:transcription termination/antitermination protein NusA [Oscillospiraceae bacterium]